MSSSAQPAHKQSRVLVVEDVRAQARLLQRLLEREGSWVKICSDGECALRCLREHDFDLVLADLRLSDTDGLILFRRTIAFGDLNRLLYGIR